MTNQLSKKIMGRIYAIYIMRQVFSYTTLKAVLSLAALIELYIAVSWGNVFANMPEITNFSAFYNFSTFAVANTAPLVQISLVIIIMLGIAQIIRLLKATQPFQISTA